MVKTTVRGLPGSSSLRIEHPSTQTAAATHDLLQGISGKGAATMPGDTETYACEWLQSVWGSTAVLIRQREEGCAGAFGLCLRYTAAHGA